LKTKAETTHYNLGKIAIQSKPHESMMNRLDQLDYGKNVSIKAQITFLELLSTLETPSNPAEGLHTKEHLQQGLNKMFHTLYANTPITSAPSNSTDRAHFYQKISNGYQFIGELMKEEVQKGELDQHAVYSCLDAIGDGGHYCAGRWRNVLEELFHGFSDKINEKMGYEPVEKDRFDLELQNLFYQSKIIVGNKMADQFVHQNFIHLLEDNKLHYTNFFKRHLNESLHHTLPVSMEEDSFLSSNLEPLKTLANQFLHQSNLGYQIIQSFRHLFQEKINTDHEFRNLYIDSAKQFFYKNVHPMNDRDVSDYLSQEIFEGFTNQVNRNGLYDVLIHKGFIEKFQKSIEVEKAVDHFINQGSFKSLEKFLADLPPDAWKNDDVKEVVNRTTPNGHTLLIHSILSSSFSFTAFLLEKGADPNLKLDHGTPPLIHATFGGHTDVARMLLEKGADIESHNRFGNTPLIVACMASRLDLVTLLLEKKADVNAVNQEGISPLIYSTAFKNKALTKLLFQKGANINIQNPLGHTPLMLAITLQDKDMVTTLLDLGANIFLEDKEGKSAIKIAKLMGNEELLNLLKEREKTHQDSLIDAPSSSNVTKKRALDLWKQKPRSSKYLSPENMDFH
jgi:ankyrin repeat protein